MNEVNEEMSLSDRERAEGFLAVAVQNVATLDQSNNTYERAESFRSRRR